MFFVARQEDRICITTPERLGFLRSRRYPGRARRGSNNTTGYHGGNEKKVDEEAQLARNIAQTYLDTMSSSAICRCCEDALDGSEEDFELRPEHLNFWASPTEQCGSADSGFS